MLRTINQKFYTFALVLVALFFFSYLQLAIYLADQKKSVQQSFRAIEQEKQIRRLQESFFEIRFWDKTVLVQNYPGAEGHFGQLLEEIKKQLHQLEKAPVDREIAQQLKYIKESLQDYEERFGRLVQLKTEQRLNRTRIESKYLALSSTIKSKGDTGLFRHLFNLSLFQSGYLENHRETEFQALMLVLDSLEKKLTGLELINERLEDHLRAYRDLLQLNMKLSKESEKAFSQFNQVSTELMELFSGTSNIAWEYLNNILEKNQKKRALLERNFTIVTIAGLVCLVFALIFMAAIMIQPIKHISHVMQRIRSGEISARFQGAGKRRDEITNLGMNMNEMLDSLEKNSLNLTQYKDELEKKVGQLASREDELLKQIYEREKLQKEKTLLAAAVEQAIESMMVLKATGEILYINPAMENLMGEKARGLVGSPPESLLPGGQSHPSYPEIRDAIFLGRVWEGRLEIEAKLDRLAILECIIFPIMDSVGEVSNYVVIGRDATREEELEHRLRQSQKMESIGTMAGGIAHDFNNILSAIMGFTELAMGQLPEPEEPYQDLLQVMQASNRAKELVQQILTFSRQNEPDYQPLEVRPIVKEALKFLRSSIPTGIEIGQEIQSRGVIMGDPTQIQQILINLCTNAFHSMENNEGVITVRLSEVLIDEDRAKQFPELKPGNHLCLEVSDTGKGMDQNTLNRIFEPYFTTKSQGKGTGLGLSVVHGVVQGHGGAITVSSRVGKGTTFCVYLPLIQRVHLPEQGRRPAQHTGSGRILFVDDEKSLASLVKRMLEGLGYKVASFTAPLEALAYFQGHAGEVDLLITDMNMPVMNGAQLIKKVHAIKPNLPAILCTGYSEVLSETNLLSLGISAMQAKPYVREELVQAIEEALQQSMDARA